MAHVRDGVLAAVAGDSHQGVREVAAAAESTEAVLPQGKALRGAPALALSACHWALGWLQAGPDGATLALQPTPAPPGAQPCKNTAASNAMAHRDF
jgi:hypothetical protein